MLVMRTTVQIDDDLAVQLRELCEETGESFTQVFNQVLRLGLTARRFAEAAPKPPFVQRTYDMGKPLVDLTKALAVADALDDAERVARMARHNMPAVVTSSSAGSEPSAVSH